MLHHLSSVLAGIGIGALAMLLPGQSTTKDILYYPFLKGSGTTVQNAASGGPKTATMVKTGNANSWVPGKPDDAGNTGYALSGSEDGSATRFNYLDTGWKGGIQGDMTIAWFMKFRSTPAVRGFPYYILSNLKGSGPLGFRIFHNGTAHLGLSVKEWGGPDLLLGSGSSGQTGPGAIDLHSMTLDNWVHVAIVFDTSLKTATFFLNAMPVRTYGIGSSQVGIPLDTATLRVGAHTSTNQTSCFDIDDFRLSNRAASWTEIVSWAGVRLFAADAFLTEGMFNISAKAGGRLVLGLLAGSANSGRPYIIAGSVSGSVPGVQLFGAHLPLNWDPWSDITLTRPAPVFANFAGFLNRDGAALASFQLPPNTPATAVGYTVFHAAVIVDPNTGQIALGTNSNPLVIFP